MDPSQGDLDNLTISQLESLLAERRHRQSRQVLRQISGRQNERGDADPRRKELLSPQGLAGPPRRPAGGRVTAPLDLPADKSDAPATGEVIGHRGAAAAALFAPERFRRSGLSAPVTPRRQRGPAWLRKAPVRRRIDVALQLAEAAFVLLLVYVVAQWLFTDASADDPSAVDSAGPGPRLAAISPDGRPAGPAISGTTHLTVTAPLSATVETPTGAAVSIASAMGGSATLAGADPWSDWGDVVPIAPHLEERPLRVDVPGAGPLPGPETSPAEAEARRYWGDVVPIAPHLEERINPSHVPGETPETDRRPDAAGAETDRYWGDTVTLSSRPQPVSTPAATADDAAAAEQAGGLAAPQATGAPVPIAEAPTPAPTPDLTSKLPIEMSIPKIKLEARVREVELRMGEDQAIWEVADYMVGHHSGTASPGEQGNMVMAGHRDMRGSVFRDLDKLEEGDEIFVRSALGTFRYVVRTTLVVRPDAVSVMEWKPDYRLTLITCTPVKIASHRLIVVADLDTGAEGAGGGE